MSVFFSILKTSIKLGPLSIFYFISCMYLWGEGPQTGDLFIVFLFGTMICWIIAFFAGLVLFGTIATIHELHPLAGNRVAIFEKLLPLFVFGFGALAGASFLAYEKDDFLVSIACGAYLSAVTGWYFFATDYFKNDE